MSPLNRIWIFFGFALLYLSCSKIQYQGLKTAPSDIKLGKTATPAVVTPDYFRHVLPNGTIALTYDDGPGPGTLALVQYLHQQHISATFFVVAAHDNDPTVGGYTNYPTMLNDMIGYGQRIGNHTYHHRNLQAVRDSFGCPGVITEVKSNQLNIDPVIKNALCYIRPPWFYWDAGVQSCIAGDHSLDKLAGPINTDWDTGDYTYTSSTRPDTVGHHFLNDGSNPASFVSTNQEGGVILMHDFSSYTVTDFALQETQVIVSYLKSQGYIFVSPTLEFSPLIPLSQGTDFSNATGWSSYPAYYGTIRTGDVNGDGKDDVIGRYSDGIHVALSTGTGLGASSIWTTEFTGSAWDAPEYSSTIQCADVNGDGKADMIIRASDGIRVCLSTGTSFQASTLWTPYFSDAPSQAWNVDIGYYGSIRAADVNGDGKADIVGRGGGGIYVALSTGSSFSAATSWTTDFSNSLGWLPAKYSTTIQVADVNGDGKADIVGRGVTGIAVALSTGAAFSTSYIWTSSFTDAQLWGSDVGYYGAIRCGDVNGDGMADLIGRGNDGLHVILSTGHSFIADKLWTSNFSDGNGWLPAYYSTTIQCGDFNGDKRTDIIGRGAIGIVGVNAP